MPQKVFPSTSKTAKLVPTWDEHVQQAAVADDRMKKMEKQIVALTDSIEALVKQPPPPPPPGTTGGIPEAPTGWPVLQFSDDFTSFSKWDPETNPSGKWRTSYAWGNQARQSDGSWGDGRGGINNERQWYSDDSFDNVTEQSKTCLRIKGRKVAAFNTPRGSFSYKSGLIASHPNYMVKPPAWIEGKFKHSKGIGIWPAFWLYNVQGDTQEIDIMEHSGAPAWNDGRTGQPAPYLQTTMSFIYPAANAGRNGYFSTGVRWYAGHGETTPNNVLGIPTISDMTADFYTISLEWQSDRLIHYFNRSKVWEYRLGAANDPSKQLSNAQNIPNPVDGMYIICNMALNGFSAFAEYIGDIQNNASLNAAGECYLWIDYVAVWKQSTSAPPNVVVPPPQNEAGIGTPYVTPSGTNMKLVFQDNFQGVAQASLGGMLYPDRSKWIETFWQGSSSRSLFGNGEAQYYMDPWYGGKAGRTWPNTYNPFEILPGQNSEGILRIKATRMADADLDNWWAGVQRPISSGMLMSMPDIHTDQPYYPTNRTSTAARKGFLMRYGYVEARMKLPRNRGTWPAFWMLPDDTPDGFQFVAPASDTYGRENEVVGYHPWGPELDIFEFFGHRPDTHSSGYVHSSTDVDNGFFEYFPKGFDITQDYHTWGFEFNSSALILSFDKQVVKTIATPAGFNHPNRRWYFIINLACGGNWYSQEINSGNYGNFGTVNAWDVDYNSMPWQMDVDYFRAYEP